MATVNKVHFIDIGELGICHLAKSLKKSGTSVTASHLEITEPLTSLLNGEGLLPPKPGWSPENIDKTYDAVIIGPHVTEENPELKKAKELGLDIYSFPEFIYHLSKDKQRIVVAGSYRSAIIEVVLRTLTHYNRRFDYMVINPEDTSRDYVRLGNGPVIIIEGDEVGTSGIDNASRFLRYNQHIGVIGGLSSGNGASVNKDLLKDMEVFADCSPKGGTIVYNAEDTHANQIGLKERADVQLVPFSIPPHKSENGKIILTDSKNPISVDLNTVSDIHCIAGAREVLKKIGITADQFYNALSGF